MRQSLLQDLSQSPHSATYQYHYQEAGQAPQSSCWWPTRHHPLPRKRKNTWTGFRWITAWVLQCNHFCGNDLQMASFEAHTIPPHLEPSANGAGRVMPTHRVKPHRSLHYMAQAPLRKEEGYFLLSLESDSALLPELLSHLSCFWPHLPPIHLPTFKQIGDNKAVSLTHLGELGKKTQCHLERGTHCLLPDERSIERKIHTFHLHHCNYFLTTGKDATVVIPRELGLFLNYRWNWVFIINRVWATATSKHASAA